MDVSDAAVQLLDSGDENVKAIFYFNRNGVNDNRLFDSIRGYTEVQRR